MPENKTAKVTEILSMLEKKAISLRTAHVMLNELGYNIPDDEINEMLGEATASVAASIDPFAGRVEEEMNDGGDESAGAFDEEV